MSESAASATIGISGIIAASAVSHAAPHGAPIGGDAREKHQPGKKFAERFGHFGEIDFDLVEHPRTNPARKTRRGPPKRLARRKMSWK